MKHVFRTLYDQQQVKISDETALNQEGEISLAQQNMADECDVNRILDRYNKTGVLEHVNETVARYGDFSDVHDFQTAINRVNEAQESFQQLPAAVRERFNNDPAQLVSFVQDKQNYDEGVKLGILTKREAPPIKDLPPTKEVVPEISEKAPTRL